MDAIGRPFRRRMPPLKEGPEYSMTHAQAAPTLPAILFALLFAIGAPASAAAQTPLDGAVVETLHEGVFNGAKVKYRAVVSETVLENDEGEPAVALSSTAYVRTNTRNKKKRPVIFIWNGGPSAASITLHMAGLGPKRLIAPTDVAAPIGPPYEIQDSPHALLDVADLVFVDPAETGLSRILPAGDRDYYYSTVGDAESVAAYIREWLSANDRGQSPVYVLGTSYGSIRAAMVTGILTDAGVTPAGTILFSQGVNLVESTQRKRSLVGYAVNMPQLAAIAHFHGKTAYQDKSVYDVIDDAYAYFMGDFLQAIAAGRSLPESARRAAAEKAAAFTGLPADYYLAHDLMVTKMQYRQELLKDHGLALASNDARYAFAPDAGASGDPAVQGAGDAHSEYFSQFLKAGEYLSSYRVMAPETGGWDYAGSSTLGGMKVPLGTPRSVFSDYDWTGELEKAFEANPSYRLMIATGVYDTLTTAGPARLLADDPGLPGERVLRFEYEGGHSFYSNENEIERLSDDLRAFIGN